MSWVPWALVLVLVLLETVRMESRLARSEVSLMQATEELAKAKRDQATELQLKRYSLDEFKAGDFTRLSVQVGVLHDEFSYFRTSHCRK